MFHHYYRAKSEVVWRSHLLITEYRFYHVTLCTGQKFFIRLFCFSSPISRLVLVNGETLCVPCPNIVGNKNVQVFCFLSQAPQVFDVAELHLETSKYTFVWIITHKTDSKSLPVHLNFIWFSFLWTIFAYFFSYLACRSCHRVYVLSAPSQYLSTFNSQLVRSQCGWLVGGKQSEWNKIQSMYGSIGLDCLLVIINGEIRSDRIQNRPIQISTWQFSFFFCLTPLVINFSLANNQKWRKEGD